MQKYNRIWSLECHLQTGLSYNSDEIFFIPIYLSPNPTHYEGTATNCHPRLATNILHK